ncbi:MAG: arsenate reductase family protein [Bacilli bacterium]
MKNLFICYPKCSTCKKAKDFLDEKHITYDFRNITTDIPTSEELKNWVDMSGLPVKKFFNKSGLMYKQLHLKDKIFLMSETELLNILATNGMLIKRPIFVTNSQVFVGFDQDEWSLIK